MSRKPGSSTRSFLAWKRASDVFFSLKFKRSIRVSTWQKGCVVSLWLGTFGGLLPRTLSYLAVKSAVAVMSLIIVEEKKLLETIMIINFFYNCHSNSGRWWKNAINMARFNLQKNRVSQVFGHVQPNSSTWKIGGAFAMSSNFILEYSSST